MSRWSRQSGGVGEPSVSRGQSAAVWKDRRAWGTPEGYVETTAGESLPAPRQSEVIGPRRDSRIAEGRTGSEKASTLTEHLL